MNVLGTALSQGWALGAGERGRRGGLRHSHRALHTRPQCHGVTSAANMAAGATRGILSMWNVAIARRDAISLLFHFNKFKFE